MKKFLLAVLLTASVSGLSFAQEDANVNRSMLFYLDSFTGQLNHNADNGQLAFADNEFEFGVSYSQNFATAQWLSIWVKALVVMGNGPSFSSHDSYLGTTPGGTSLGTTGANFLAAPRAQVGLNFGGWAILAMDTRGLLATEVYYTLRFGAGGNLTFQGILEMWAVPLAATDIDGNFHNNVVDLFEIRLNYEVAIAQGWTFRSKLGFRFGGKGIDWAAIDQSATAFGESFHIRWENQVVWSITPSFFVWTQLRYQAHGFAGDTIADREAKGVDQVQHDVYLQAGLGYTLNLSGL